MPAWASGALVPPSPFVLKDPRFSYTLPAWRPVLPPVRVVVVVRHPSEVVTSVAAMARREPATFSGFPPTRAHLLAMWEAVYRSVLSWADDATLFVAHEDVARPSGRARLEVATGTTLLSRPRPDLHREHGRTALPGSTVDLLAELSVRCDAPASGGPAGGR